MNRKRRTYTTVAEDPNLVELLNDMRVIIVGNSRYLVETPICAFQGDLIDDYDIVVRLDQPVPNGFSIDDDSWVPKDLQPYLGTKTHIQYAATEYIAESLLHRISSFIDSGGCMFCVTSDPIGLSCLGKAASKKRKVDGIKIRENIYYRLWSTYMFLLAKQEFRSVVKHNTEPDVATLALFELLAHGIKEIRLIGITANHWHSEIELLKEHGHKESENSLTWLKWRLDTDGRIIIDNVLFSIMDQRFNDEGIYQYDIGNSYGGLA